MRDRSEQGELQVLYVSVLFGISSQGLLLEFMQTDILRGKPASKCKFRYFFFFFWCVTEQCGLLSVLPAPSQALLLTIWG